MPDIPFSELTGQVTTKLGRVCVVPRGEYKPEETYSRLDIVQYGGSGWLCLKDGTTGAAPAEGESWMCFAAASAVASGNIMTKDVYDTGGKAEDIFGYVDTAVSNVKIAMDDAPTAESENAVKSGGIYTALEGKANGVDLAAKADQTAMEAALALKQDALTFDETPVEASGNPVKSGGVYDAVKWHSNPNLMDNWYFGNPVNQRGQTEYTATGYTIDRWHMTNTSTTIMSCTVSNGVITIEDTGTEVNNFGMLRQLFENPEQFKGVTVTCSALVRPQADGTFRLAIWDGVDTNNGTYITKNTSVTSGEITLIQNTVTPTNGIHRIGLQPWTHAVKFDILAAKLELGDQQTLAHKEDGVWVLNEVSNYEEQLLRCMRYMQVLPGIQANTSWSCIGLGLGHSGARVLVNIPLIVPMRNKGGTISFDGEFGVVSSGSWNGAIRTTNITKNQYSDNIMSINALVESGIQVDQPYFLVAISGSNHQIIFDANL